MPRKHPSLLVSDVQEYPAKGKKGLKALMIYHLGTWLIIHLKTSHQTPPKQTIYTLDSQEFTRKYTVYERESWISSQGVLGYGILWKFHRGRTVEWFKVPTLARLAPPMWWVRIQPWEVSCYAFILSITIGNSQPCSIEFKTRRNVLTHEGKFKSTFSAAWSVEL